MNIFRILLIFAASVGLAIADPETFLPAKNETKSKSGHHRETFLATKNETEIGHHGETFLPATAPAKNETEIGHHRATLVEPTKAGKVEATKAKAGKAPSGKPLYSDEGLLHRKREHKHKCSVTPFKGHWMYQSGCDGTPWEVTIKCEKKGRGEERNSGLTCTYYEKKLVSVLCNLLMSSLW